MAALGGASLVAAGCQTTAQQISRKEDSLVAAGFTRLPANTPAREAQLATLPPNRFMPKTDGDTTNYIYADPVVCHCLYVGSQTAYGTYMRTLQTQRQLDQAQLTALTYQNAWNWDRWDWGPWGGGWWWR
ncbi:MAG: hypothetical protein EPO51_07610 [Phenylobacterium sp.]|nr:MAG: hypothetical protein EPO51_07610 [Phenylobacterium sp.]